MKIQELRKKIRWHINYYWNLTLSTFTFFPGEFEIKNEYRCYKWAVRRFRKKNRIWSTEPIPCVPLKAGGEKKIWIYWNSGETEAPLLVKKCINSIRAFKPQGYEVQVVDFENLLEWVGFPDFILKKHEKGIIPEAHFSDLVRSCLLYFYGGIWMDATCFMTSPFPSKLISQPFFMFQTDLFLNPIPMKSSNWFIISEENNLVLKYMIHMLVDYWGHHNNLKNYFLYHIFIKALSDNDKYTENIFNEMPYFSNQAPHLMLFSLPKKYSEEMMIHLKSTSFVHKLTYKFKKEILQDKNSLLYHILFND